MLVPSVLLPAVVRCPKSGVYRRTHFRRVMTDFVKCVVEESHHSFQSAHDGPRSCRLHTTSEEVWAFIAFLLRVMADNKPEERAFIRSQEFSDSKLLSQRKAEFLSTHLTRSYESMVRALNAGLRSILQAGGVSCIDENIFPWFGESPSIVHVPSKPNPHDLRCFVHAMKLTRTRLPVPVRILPELCRPAYSPNVVLDTFALQMHDSPYSITADSYFGSLDWLAAILRFHPGMPSLKSDTLCFSCLPMSFPLVVTAYSGVVRCVSLFGAIVTW